jgi:LmbE family N-acetylglucosaminyl deacetylase
MRRFFILAMSVFLATAPAQNRLNFPLAAQDSGHIALGLALRKLGVSGTFLQTAAHPDDETNALYAMFTHGMGLRSIDVQTTRGEGGQNEIGPELFGDIGVLRTSELLAAHRLDGSEQYFTRAIDYGYSFDPKEVIDKWGRKEIVGDFVRLIRTFRPDVVLTMNMQGRGGDRAHEATTILTREAYKAAADPAMYPEQGLRAWQPKKLYMTSGFGGGRGGPPPITPAVKLVAMNTAKYDSLLGRTYAEIGTDARSSHKCQGMSGPPPLPGATNGRGGGRGGYQLVETTIPGEMGKEETSLFDGIDTRIAALAQYAGANPPADLTAGLAAIADAAAQAQGAFDAGNDAGTAAPVEAGLAAVRSLRSRLGSMGLSEQARFEIDFRLKNKERDYEDAVLAAQGLTFDAVADDGLVIGGQAVKLSLIVVNRGASEVNVTNVAIAGFDGAGACKAGPIKRDAVYTCSEDAHVPKDAKLTTPYFSDHYWKHPASNAINVYGPGVEFGVPFQPTPFRVTFHVQAGTAEVTKEIPVQYRYVKDLYTGDKRMELNVEPEFSVRMTPPLAVFPAANAGTREIHVSVTNSTKGNAQVSVALDLPEGWTATPYFV